MAFWFEVNCIGHNICIITGVPMKRSPQNNNNLLTIAEDYFNNMFSEVHGMKALILDKETSGIMSVVYTQTKLYKHDVYLIQKVGDESEKLQHLKAVYFIRPQGEAIDFLLKELKDPRFMEYHLCFTNEVAAGLIEKLATADSADRIRSLQQLYLDYFALQRNLFSLNIPSTIGLTKKQDAWNQADKSVLKRMADGIISAVMSLRLMPQVRYLAGSSCCAKLGKAVADKLEVELAEKQSDYRLGQRAILLITERKEDIITPLMTPWSYVALLHEFVGVFNNKIDFVKRQKAFVSTPQPTTKQGLREKEETEYVVSEITDEFYRSNVYNLFGELASNIKTFIHEMGNRRNQAMKLDSLEDMQSALDKLPELNAQSSTLQKHVNLSCEISKCIEKGVLFEVSKVEQDLICQDSRSNSQTNVWRILKNEKVDFYRKMKLVLLYSIKYPNHKEITEMLEHLKTIHNDQSLPTMIQLMSQYQVDRKSDLFNLSSIKKKAESYFKMILKDVPNVYTQHRPYIFEQTIPDLLTDKTKETDYKTIFTSRSSQTKSKPIIIVFFVGGATYTEARQADLFEDAKVIIGGSFIQSSKTFIAEVMQQKGLLEYI